MSSGLMSVGRSGDLQLEDGGSWEILGVLGRAFSAPYPLPAQYTDRVDLKDGLLNNRVYTVKFSVVESYFLCNTTHTAQAINHNGPGGLVIQVL